MCLAIPGIIQSIVADKEGLFRSAHVSFDGVAREVNLAAVPDAAVGDYVLVHVGMALSVIDQEEALKTLEYFKEMDVDNDEIRKDMEAE